MSVSDQRYSGAASFESAQPAPSHPHRVRIALPLRLAFIGACGVAAASAAWFAGTGGVQNADPDLAKLLKGMAIIKTVILLAVAAAIWWRLGLDVRPAYAAGYILFGALGVAGAALVWSMAGLGLAPFLFDGGLLGFLILALRDDNGPWLHALTSARSRRSE